MIGVLAQHLAHGKFHRAIVLDDNDPAGNGNFAVCECIQRINQLLSIHARMAADFNLHILGCKIVNRFHLQLALLHRVLDGRDERLGRGCGRNLFDDDGGFVLGLDLGPDFYRAFAVLIIASVHQTASGEIWQTLERLFVEDCDLSFKQFGEVMGQNARCQTDCDPFRPEHERERQFAWQSDRLFVAPIVARNEIGNGIVENFRAGEFRQPALDVTRSRRRISGEDIAEISLTLDEVTLVRQHHERVAYGRIAVRMILHCVTDDIGDFDEAPVILLMQRPENAPLHRLQTVGEIRNRAVADDVAGIIQKAAINPRVQPDFELFRIERLVDNSFDRLGDDVVRAAAIAIVVGRLLCGRVFRAFDGQLRLVRTFFLLLRTHERRALSNRKPVMARVQPALSPLTLLQFSPLTILTNDVGPFRFYA